MNNNDAIQLTVTEGIATLTFNEPAKLNALSVRLIDGMMVALEQLRADTSVRVLQLIGTGKAFSMSLL